MNFYQKSLDNLQLGDGESRNIFWKLMVNIPKKICFMAWGDKIDQYNIKQGETVEVSVDLESREYNGRWYTDVKAWKVARYGDAAYRDTTYDKRGDYENRHENVASINDEVIAF